MRSLRVISGRTTFLEAVAEIGMLLEDAGYHLSAAEGPERQPLVLAYTPPARANAFQALLYHQAIAHGVAPLPVKQMDTLAQLPWPGPMVCHFHWVASALSGAASPAEADERIARFAGLLDELKSQGRRILWTAHNVLPHDCAWPEKEIEVRRLLVEASDAVHIMVRDTPRMVADIFELPEEKTFYTPHPAYLGAYPDMVSRSEARSELGVRRDEFAFVLFGALQRYKGVDELRVAFERLAADVAPRRVRLLIAGAPADAELAEDLELWALGRDDVTADLVKIPNEDVQHYYRAADVAVLPYRQTLNSGSALLAYTFGVPIVAPDRGAFRELTTEFAGITYDPADPDGLYRAMAGALEEDLEPMRRRIGIRIGALAPDIVSRSFFEQLRARLDQPAAPAPTSPAPEATRV